MDPITSLDVFERFIGVAKELAKLPALLLPQYQAAARDLYEICQKLLAANENLSRWLHRFLYFDFRHPDGRGEFHKAVQDYKTMKVGPSFQHLKFSCNDIGYIYHREIASKLGKWLTNQQRLEEAEGVFQTLVHADAEMVSFVYDGVMQRLDSAVDEMEKHVDAGALDQAEGARLSFKADSKELTERLEEFSGDLSDLVIRFATMARVPVSLGTSQ